MCAALPYCDVALQCPAFRVNAPGQLRCLCLHRCTSGACWSGCMIKLLSRPSNGVTNHTECHTVALQCNRLTKILLHILEYLLHRQCSTNCCISPQKRNKSLQTLSHQLCYNFCSVPHRNAHRDGTCCNAFLQSAGLFIVMMGVGDHTSVLTQGLGIHAHTLLLQSTVNKHPPVATERALCCQVRHSPLLCTRQGLSRSCHARPSSAVHRWAMQSSPSFVV